MTESWVNDENALGTLVKHGVRHALCPNEYLARSGILSLRHIWPTIVPYFQREIIVEIEIALLRQDRSPLALADEWQQLRDDLRGPKSPFTVDYRCGSCGAADVKLWRGVHGCKSNDGHELLCARCLAPPGVTVGDDGRAPCDMLRGQKSGQINGWLPAVPVGDTYWGYTSVPSQDADWWRALPTYAPSLTGGEE